MIESLSQALALAGALDAEVYEEWRKKLFETPCPAGQAPWDPWLDKEWRKKSRTTFSEIADFYNDDAFVSFMANHLPSWPIALSEHLPGLVTSGQRVLDYGCGHGREGISCLSVGARVTFADVSARLLKGVDTFCRAHGHETEQILVTDEVPTLEIGKYDLVVTYDVLEHVQQPVAVLQKLVHSMVLGGHLLMTVFFNGHEMALYHLPANFHLNDPGKWARVCASAGLQPVEGRVRTYRRVI